MPIEFDSSAFPLLVSTFRGSAQIEDHIQYLAQLERFFTGPPVVSIVVTKDPRRPDRETLRLQSEWFKRHWEECQRQWLGVVFVFESALPRFGLSALLLLTRLPAPHTTVGTFSAGLDWACDILRQRGYTPPNPLPVAPR